MVKITFVEHDGRKTVVDARPGVSLMKNAVAADVPGVLAECGGNCACGTCRIYFDPEWGKLMPSPRESKIVTVHKPRYAPAALSDVMTTSS